MKGTKQKGKCPLCKGIPKSKAEMCYEILKKIGYPFPYYKKGDGTLNYWQTLAIYKWIMEK